jgi:hypothetical protein
VVPWRLMLTGLQAVEQEGQLLLDVRNGAATERAGMGWRLDPAPVVPPYAQQALSHQQCREPLDQSVKGVIKTKPSGPARPDCQPSAPSRSRSPISQCHRRVRVIQHLTTDKSSYRSAISTRTS